MEKKLSICVPTYKRKLLLYKLLDEIFCQLHKFESSDIEVVVSVNPSEDNVQEEIGSRYSYENYKLNINRENIGGVKNLYKTIEMASGKLIWVVGDDDYIVPGLIEKVITAIRMHPNISWIYINAARLNGDAADPNVKLCEAYSNKINDSGYFEDGKAELLRLFRRIDARVLFSTSNIYLRSAAVAIYGRKYADDFNSLHDIFFQLTGTFYSASQGGAYIIPEASIIEGENISWSETAYFVSVHAINDAVYVAKDWNYTEKQVKRIIRHRMVDGALVTWLAIFKKIVHDPEQGIADYRKYFRYFPVMSICMVLFCWIWMPYLIIRKLCRDIRRRLSLIVLRKQKDLPECIKERL